jgi:hypothetical protein
MRIKSAYRMRNAMKLVRILLALPLAGCQANESPNNSALAEPVRPHAAVSLVGDWLVVAPSRLKGDTRRLRADSTAEGIIPWPPNRYARVSRWKIRYMSKDPVGTREDWRQGFSDGGDAECMRDGEPGCVSLPTLCLGAEAQYVCEAFAQPADSLLLSTGLQYVRIAPKPRSD